MLRETTATGYQKAQGLAFSYARLQKCRWSKCKKKRYCVEKCGEKGRHKAVVDLRRRPPSPSTFSIYGFKNKMCRQSCRRYYVKRKCRRSKECGWSSSQNHISRSHVSSLGQRPAVPRYTDRFLFLEREAVRAVLQVWHHRQIARHASSINASSPASLHSLECFVSFFTPAIRPAHRLSDGVRNVYPL